MMKLNYLIFSAFIQVVIFGRSLEQSGTTSTKVLVTISSVPESDTRVVNNVTVFGTRMSTTTTTMASNIEETSEFNKTTDEDLLELEASTTTTNLSLIFPTVSVITSDQTSSIPPNHENLPVLSKIGADILKAETRPAPTVKPAPKATKASVRVPVNRMTTVTPLRVRSKLVTATNNKTIKTKPHPGRFPKRLKTTLLKGTSKRPQTTRTSTRAPSINLPVRSKLPIDKVHGIQKLSTSAVTTNQPQSQQAEQENSHLTGVHQFVVHSHPPFDVPTFLPRPVEEDYEDYELPFPPPVDHPEVPRRPMTVSSAALRGHDQTSHQALSLNNQAVPLPPPTHLMHTLQVHGNGSDDITDKLVINTKRPGKFQLKPHQFPNVVVGHKPLHHHHHHHHHLSQLGNDQKLKPFGPLEEMFHPVDPSLGGLDKDVLMTDKPLSAEINSHQAMMPHFPPPLHFPEVLHPEPSREHLRIPDLTSSPFFTGLPVPVYQRYWPAQV